ncbi:MAG: hemerythrin family protein [Pirellulales bacterium]|nr:hemerythrin family protein [Pirellulales bacterium]
MSISFQWDESYCVDGGQIDEEHKKLFTLANETFSIVDPASQSDRFKQTIKGLYDYMRYHFSNEEQLMRRVAYPDFQDHVRKHNAIINRMNKCLKGTGNLAELAHGMKHCCVDWVMTHILEEDKKVGRHIRSVGGSATETGEIAASAGA